MKVENQISVVVNSVIMVAVQKIKVESNHVKGVRIQNP